MRVSELAKFLGVSPDFLRDLEARGIIPVARRDLNNHRRYFPGDMEKIREILLSKPKTSSEEGLAAMGQQKAG